MSYLSEEERQREQEENIRKYQKAVAENNARINNQISTKRAEHERVKYKYLDDKTRLEKLQKARQSLIKELPSYEKFNKQVISREEQIAKSNFDGQRRNKLKTKINATKTAVTSNNRMHENNKMKMDQKIAELRSQMTDHYRYMNTLSHQISQLQSQLI